MLPRASEAAIVDTGISRAPPIAWKDGDCCQLGLATEDLVAPGRAVRRLRGGWSLISVVTPLPPTVLPLDGHVPSGSDKTVNLD